MEGEEYVPTTPAPGDGASITMSPILKMAIFRALRKVPLRRDFAADRHSRHQFARIVWMVEHSTSQRNLREIILRFLRLHFSELDQREEDFRRRNKSTSTLPDFETQLRDGDGASEIQPNMSAVRSLRRTPHHAATKSLYETHAPAVAAVVREQCGHTQMTRSESPPGEKTNSLLTGVAAVQEGCEACGRGFANETTLFSHQRKHCKQAKRNIREVLVDARAYWTERVAKRVRRDPSTHSQETGRNGAGERRPEEQPSGVHPHAGDVDEQSLEEQRSIQCPLGSGLGPVFVHGQDNSAVTMGPGEGCDNPMTAVGEDYNSQTELLRYTRDLPKPIPCKQ
ncbi:hypothetical protein BKA70DRAFT_1219071 [Coprinopsis sp. MPI-PUGE-AT-0042]|nr:hypothetical protein BKA70DRAFT_1219071 [Coprinopsis sp. MPI-PUGE-AT-0042]